MLSSQVNCRNIWSSSADIIPRTWVTNIDYGVGFQHWVKFRRFQNIISTLEQNIPSFQTNSPSQFPPPSRSAYQKSPWSTVSIFWIWIWVVLCSISESVWKVCLSESEIFSVRIFSPGIAVPHSQGLDRLHAGVPILPDDPHRSPDWRLVQIFFIVWNENLICQKCFLWSSNYNVINKNR